VVAGGRVGAGGEGEREALGQLVDLPAGLAVGRLDVAIETTVRDDLDDARWSDERESTNKRASGRPAVGRFPHVARSDGRRRGEADGAAGEARRVVRARCPGVRARAGHLFDGDSGLRRPWGRRWGRAVDAVRLGADEAEARHLLAAGDGPR
jgi:hypothetical protein